MLTLLLVAIIVLLVVMLVSGFGMSDEPHKCPTCGMGELSRMYRGPVRGGPIFYCCDQCPGKFRQRFDGRLVAADPDPSA